MAIDLIVQHIRDFLNNRSRYGSTTNINHDNTNGIGFRGSTTAAIGGVGRLTSNCLVRIIPPPLPPPPTPAPQPIECTNQKYMKINKAVAYIRPH